MVQETAYKYKVATQCMTYNHAMFIEETLRGFAMQQLSFPVAYVIVDDSSNDGEQEVLNKWAELNLINDEEGVAYRKELQYGEVIYARHKKNSNAYFVLLLLFENHYQTGRDKLKFEYINEWCDNAEYIAICEGDDYWSDPLKLQIQVEELEKDSSYVLCFTDYLILNTNGIYKVSQIKDLPVDDNYSEVLFTKGNKVATLTVLIKNDAYKKTPRLGFVNNWKMGDLPLWIELSQLGLFKYIPVVTSVYRKLDNSASHSTNIKIRLDFIKNTYEIKEYYAKYYNKRLNSSFFRKKMFEALLNEAFISEDIELSRTLYAEARLNKISSFDIWKTYLLTVYKANPIIRTYLYLRRKFR